MQATPRQRQEVKIPRPPSASINFTTNKQQSIDYFNKGKQLQMVGKIQQALNMYQRATYLNNMYFQAFCNKGYCLKMLKRYNDAKKCYLRALKINNKDAISHYNIANLYRIIGDLDSSIQHYNYVNFNCTQSPIYLDSLINTGICYKNLQKYQEAIAIYQRVNQVAPQDQCGIFNYAMCLVGYLQKVATLDCSRILNLYGQKALNLFNKKQKTQFNHISQIAKIKLKIFKNYTLQNIQCCKKQIQLLKNDLRFIQYQGQLEQALNFCDKQTFIINNNGKEITPISSKRSFKIKPEQIIIQQNKQLKINAVSTYLGQGQILTQQTAFQLIQKGEFNLLQIKLQNLEEGFLRQSILLMAYAKLAQFDPSYMIEAKKIYETYFVQNGQCIGFSKISKQTHRSLGKLKFYYGQYEQSAKHYDYISKNMTPRSNSSSLMHHSIAEGFQHIGQKHKAIQQYEKALQLEYNFVNLYSLACCLYDQNRLKQAKQKFIICLGMIQSSQIPEQQKIGDKAECLIFIALCNQKEHDQFQWLVKAHQSYLLFKRQAQNQLQVNLLFFYNQFASVLQKKYQENKQDNNLLKLLISAYDNMLSCQKCPEKDQLNLSLGYLYYKDKRYINSLKSYQSVKRQNKLPYSQLGLCYLHLLEFTQAMKYMQRQVDINSNDSLALFNLDLIKWILFNKNDGPWNSLLPYVKDYLTLQRYYFSVILIENIEQKIQKSNQDIRIIINKEIQFVKNNNYMNQRYKKITNLINKCNNQKVTKSNFLNCQQIMKLIFYRHNQKINEFKKLINLLQKQQQILQKNLIIQIIYMYIYNNKQEKQTYKQIMKKKIQNKIGYFHYNLQNIQITQGYTLQSNFKNIKQLIQLLSQWSCCFQSIILQIIKEIQILFYQNNIIKPLQIFNNFLVHQQLKGNSSNFKKLYKIMSLFISDFECKLKGRNINQMKNYYIKQYQKFVPQVLYVNPIKNIQIKQQFLPISIKAIFQSKQQCQKFIQKLINKQNFSLQSFKQYNIIIQGLVSLNCKWQTSYMKNQIQQSFSQIMNNPLDLYIQAITSLSDINNIVPQQQQIGKIFIKQFNSFKL